jgi:hypothetical protein
VSRPALGPTQPPVQWVPGVLFPGVKRGRVVTLTTHPIYCQGREWVGAIPPLPPSAFIACSGTALPFFNFYMLLYKFRRICVKFGTNLPMWLVERYLETVTKVKLPVVLNWVTPCRRVGEWRDSSTVLLSTRWRWLASRASRFIPEDRKYSTPVVAVGLEAEWTRQPVSALYGRGTFCLAGNQTPGRPVRVWSLFWLHLKVEVTLGYANKSWDGTSMVE